MTKQTVKSSTKLHGYRRGQEERPLVSYRHQACDWPVELPAQNKEENGEISIFTADLLSWMR